MKVLLTGANGFVGSHVLDCLRAKSLSTAILLRETSNQRFIEPHLPHVEVRLGCINDLESLTRALHDVTHVIHCAGLTRVRRVEEFYEGNHLGTRRVVEAVNRQGNQIRRLVHISSLAASGPAPRRQPAREDDAPHPISDYGKSKLAGELEVQNHCQTEFVVLRPPAVYGPRDEAFLQLFKAIHWRVLPKFLGGVKAMSFVFVKDLAEAVVTCLTHPAAAGKTYFTAARAAVAPHDFAKVIAEQVGIRVLTLPLPTAMLWSVCVVQEAFAKLTRKPSILNRQKYAELSAPGWVCDPTRLREETGFDCATPPKEGIAQTIAWYRQHGWL